MISQAIRDFVMQWEAFLRAQRIAFGKAPDQLEPLYDLTFPAHFPDILEYHITVHAKAHVMYFETAIPVTAMDKDAALVLINQLNFDHPIGFYQYDRDDSELTWTQHLALSNWQFPDTECLVRMLERSEQMVSRICQALTSQEAAKEDATT